ncbi:conserved hypothetical protein [[Clostridium] ultunense Esp]|uniref:DUF302 domain-containing protein n=1 Tax=[Clostridium] ultunense Esp TaxID=1288971 RepID=M1ZHA4_9FIRM|nr:DUF302 domain-containing protein [Schnuerera ultunensis]CCQ98241.1 conserved hypothetical protein [[Clostridium] ultunense Esp]SHD78625.1 conserved protein of unknown function [[Clostridium] ultunense Esp]
MDFIYEVKTLKSFKQAIDSIKESLAENNFGVLWEMNIQDKLKEKGVDFKENFQILEICNPHKAKNVLEENMQVGYFLPCKVTVYERDGQVMIGMPKPTSLLGMMGETELGSIAEEVEEVLKRAIHDAVK